MKNLLFTVLLLANLFFGFAFEENEFTQNLELNRIGVNFNGSASNGNSLLVYGEGGTIMRSIDGGTTWKKIVLADSFDIVGIVNKELQYLGLTSHRWGIRSMDNGKTWNFVDLGNYNFYQILPYGGNFVALTENKIIVFDDSFNKIKEYSYNTDANYYRATISGNKIFCSSGYGKITMLDLENGNNQTLSLSDFGICSNCPIVMNLISDSKGKVFFSLDKYLFVFDPKNSTVDTLVFLQRNLSYSTFSISNDEIYYIFSRKILSSKDTLFFVKIDQNNKEYIKINQGSADRYISDLAFVKLNFFDNKIVAVGKNNLIYISNDGGIHWDLKSFLGKYDFVNLFEGTEWRAIGPYATFYYSSDNGVTWLPTKSYYNDFYTNYKFENIINNRGLYFFKDKNNGIIFYPTGYENEKNTVFTTDGGTTLKFQSLTKNFNEEFQTFAIENNNKYLFFQWGCLNWGLGCWSTFRSMDDTLGLEWDNAIRGTQMFFATKFNQRIYSIAKDSSEPNDVYSIYYTEDNGNNWTKDFTFKIDLPIQLRCDKATLIESENSIFATWSKPYFPDKDTFLIQSCYRIDLKNKTARKLIETRGESISDFIKIKDRYFFRTAYFVFQNNQLSVISNMFSTNDIDSENIIWDTVKFDRFSVARIDNVIGDSVIIFTAYDRLTNNSFLYFAKVKNVTDVEEMVEYEPINPIYISQPIPNPAKEVVKFNIYWDQRYDIDRSQIRVYNLLGEVVSKDTDFELSKKNNYSGELKWKINGIPSGVYYLLITNGVHHSSTKVVIQE